MEQPPPLPAEPIPPIPWAAIGRFLPPTLRLLAFAVFGIIFLAGFAGWCNTFAYVRDPGQAPDQIVFSIHPDPRHFGYFLQWFGALAGIVLTDIAISLAAIKHRLGPISTKTSN